jgi:hypothetical protein
MTGEKGCLFCESCHMGHCNHQEVGSKIDCTEYDHRYFVPRKTAADRLKAMLSECDTRPPDQPTNEAVRCPECAPKETPFGIQPFRIYDQDGTLIGTVRVIDTHLTLLLDHKKIENIMIGTLS